MPVALRRWWFRALARVGATVVVGTHRDLSQQAARSGLTVVTHSLGPVDFDTLRKVVDERLRAAAVNEVTFVIDDEDLRRSHALANGSLRSVERHLHELVADRVRTG